MDQNPNSSNSSSMGSLFSSPDPETLGSNPDPSPPPPASPEVGEPPSSDAGSGKSEKSTGDPPKQEVERGGEVREEEGEEEEAECGFCLFMKAGGCKDEFVAWEKCVEDAEKDGGDIAEKCFEVTSKLKQCMDAHADYYEPILSAEKAMANEVEREKGEEESKEEEEEEEAAESEERTVEIVVDESRS